MQKQALELLTSYVPGQPNTNETSIASIYRCSRYGLFLAETQRFLTIDPHIETCKLYEMVMNQVDAITQEKVNNLCNEL